MSGIKERFLFACAPDSWGVLDYPGPSWEQSYELMLDEMVEAGYTGTELGPYGFFPTDPKVLKPQLEKRKLKLLGSFVPVKMTDPSASTAVMERIRKVGHLLATLKAPFLVMADDQSAERNAYSGRIYDPGCPTLSAHQWKHVGEIVADAEKVANEFGLDLVFHPHVATYVESPEECERFYRRDFAHQCRPVPGHRPLSLWLRRPGEGSREIQEQAALCPCEGLRQQGSGTSTHAISGRSKKPSSTRCSPSSEREISIFPPSSAPC